MMLNAGLRLLADAGGGASFDPYSVLASTGISGIVVVLLISGKLRTESEVKRLVSENERKDTVIKQKDEQIVSLQAGIVEQAIPVLTRSTSLLEKLAESGLTDRRRGD
jgi:hypothetical protein